VRACATPAWQAPPATSIAIAARFLWTFPVAHAPRWISKRLAARDRAPPWQTPFMLALTGIRGVVSLAAVLAIPMITGDGRPVPQSRPVPSSLWSGPCAL